MENNLRLQKQGKAFFCDYSPNYRLNAEKEESFSDEIFFHGYRPSAGDICIDIGAGLGLDTSFVPEYADALALVQLGITFPQGITLQAESK